MTRDRDTRLAPRIILYGIGRLFPGGLDTAERVDWLRAPLAGAPLYRRMLEPIHALGADIIDVVDSGPGSRAFVELLTEHPCFGLRARLLAPQGFQGLVSEPLLIVPASGLFSIDLDEIVSALYDGDDSLAPVTVTSMVCSDEDSEPLVAVPAGIVLSRDLIPEPYIAELIDDAAGVGRELVTRGEERLWRVDSPAALHEVARAALQERTYDAVGDLSGSLLLGAHAKVSPDAVVDGVAAVGANSFVAPGAMLTDGAIIGEDCYIAEGALVSDAIVLDGTRLAPGDCVMSTVHGAGGAFGD